MSKSNNHGPGPKYPSMSKTKPVVPTEVASIDPFELGTIAILDVTMPSKAFRVETNG